MKGIDIFCASQSTTSICISMASSSYSTPAAAAGSSSPAIDRHNPIITDSRRLSTYSIQLQAIPPPLQKKKKKSKKIPLKENVDHSNHKKNIDINDGGGGGGGDGGGGDGESIKISTTTTIGRKSFLCTKPGDFITPSPGSSTRFLLSTDQNLVDFVPSLKSETPIANYTKPPSFSSASTDHDQVVVLRVSLHCRGCERKMRKHISRMEGVKSFNIDFAAKKVTVTGKVTPVEVLSSISKVKNAQLWPPTISSSTPPPLPPPPLNRSNSFEFENKGDGAYHVTDKRFLF
ncbi:hypothetical protein ABFS83_10G037000 [Erythranthe nasuta]